jgi:predicted transcriptional regulator of viral defense system
MPDIRTIIVRRGGVATRAELLDAGVPDSRVRRMLEKGILVPVSRGVYTLAENVTAAEGDPAREHALAAAAAARLAGPRAAVSHRSAAMIHGLDLLTKPGPSTVMLTRSPQRSQSRSSRGTAALHIAELPPEHVTFARGVPVTTVARTVIDLSRILPFADGVVAGDAALHKKMTTLSELQAVLAYCDRWPGARRAKRATAFSDARAESALESIARVAFHQGGLPPPQLQAWVGDADQGVVIGRVDFFWPEHRTVGEADGALKYSDSGRAVSQLRRDALLRAAGFEVVHFTWHEITVVPGQVVAALWRAFERGDGARRRNE